MHVWTYAYSLQVAAERILHAEIKRCNFHLRFYLHRKELSEERVFSNKVLWPWYRKRTCLQTYLSV